jgi:hypothetical protein
MFRRRPPEPENNEPVLRTPPGAVPRGLRTDNFEIYGIQARAAVQVTEDAPVTKALPLPVEPAAPRDWDFAMPAARAVEPEAKCGLIEPDANPRYTDALLRSPQPDIVSSADREKFSGNWERLAAEPAFRRERLARSSFLRRWLFTADGRFDAASAVGPLLLLLLLAAIVVMGRRVISAPEPHDPPPVKVPSN